MFLNQKKFIYEMKNNYTKGLQCIFLIVNLFQFNFHFNFFFLTIKIINQKAIMVLMYSDQLNFYNIFYLTMQFTK